MEPLRARPLAQCSFSSLRSAPYAHPLNRARFAFTTDTARPHTVNARITNPPATNHPLTAAPTVMSTPAMTPPISEAMMPVVGLSRGCMGGF